MTQDIEGLLDRSPANDGLTFCDGLERGDVVLVGEGEELASKVVGGLADVEGGALVEEAQQRPHRLLRRVLDVEDPAGGFGQAFLEGRDENE